MKETIVSLFDSLPAAHAAVQDLLDAGIAQEGISIVAREASETQDSAHARRPHSGEQTVRGAETGAVIGGLSGLLLGLTPLAAPGIGAIMVGGWLLTTLIGAGIGAVTGGIGGALTEHGLSEAEAEQYTEGVRRGGTLVIVRTTDMEKARILPLMQRHGAIDIQERVAQWAQENSSAENSSAESPPAITENLRS